MVEKWERYVHAETFRRGTNLEVSGHVQIEKRQFVFAQIAHLIRENILARLLEGCVAQFTLVHPLLLVRGDLAPPLVELGERFVDGGIRECTAVLAVDPDSL